MKKEPEINKSQSSNPLKTVLGWAMKEKENADCLVCWFFLKETKIVLWVTNLLV